MKFIVRISLKSSILDPQGDAISNSLKSLGFEDIKSIRQGKIIEIDLEESNRERGVETIKKMCHKLLVNNVIENFLIETE